MSENGKLIGEFQEGRTRVRVFKKWKKDGGGIRIEKFVNHAGFEKFDLTPNMASQILTILTADAKK